MTESGFNCCSDPRPRVSEVTGRFFCARCHQYLDVQARPGDAPREKPRNDTGREEADQER